MEPERIRENLNKLRSYAERNGLSAAFFRSVEGIREAYADRIYSDEAAMLPKVSNREKSSDGPFLSLIIPACNPDMDDFAHLLDSLSQQEYTNFEVVIADGGNDDGIGRVVSAYDADPDIGLNIKYKKLNGNRGISGNTNEALSIAEGEYAVFIDHDDFIEPDALMETVSKIKDGALMVYTDEDKYDGLRDRYLSPNRKPGFNLDLLLSNNYICHLLTVKKSLVDEIGGLRGAFDGAQDHDLLLRLSEIVPREKIAHIPKVLYHWRLSPGSTAGNPESKLYAYENGKKAVRDYFSRRNLGVRVYDSAHRGFYRTDYSCVKVGRDSFILVIDKRLAALTPEYESCLGGYFARDEVGIVGARIIGKSGRTISNGYIKDADGRRVPEYGRMDYRFSGYMHRASLVRETEAISSHAFAIRRELKDIISDDAFTMCSKARDKGYTVIVDPGVIFKLR